MNIWKLLQISKETIHLYSHQPKTAPSHMSVYFFPTLFVQSSSVFPQLRSHCSSKFAFCFPLLSFPAFL